LYPFLYFSRVRFKIIFFFHIRSSILSLIGRFFSNVAHFRYRFVHHHSVPLDSCHYYKYSDQCGNRTLRMRHAPQHRSLAEGKWIFFKKEKLLYFLTISLRVTTMDEWKRKWLKLFSISIRNSTRAQIRVQCYPICRE
jgi:hypothetical protein